MAARTRSNLIRAFLTVLFSIGALNHFALAGSLLISWDPVADSRVAGYKVKYGTSSKSYTNFVDAGLSTNQLLPNLTEGTRYYFAVVAYDGARAEGVPSPEASGLVLTISVAPTVSVGSRSAVISWQTNKASDQQVLYGTTTAYEMSTLLDPNLTLSHSQTLTNLLPETTYHYRVKSSDAGGSVAQSADLTFTTPAEVLISALSPTGGTTGTSVVINGKGFGTSSTGAVVTFAGVSAPVVSWGQSSITTSVPSGATSGPVVVTVKNTPSNAVTFKINGKLAAPGRVRRQ